MLSKLFGLNDTAQIFYYLSSPFVYALISRHSKELPHPHKVYPQKFHLSCPLKIHQCSHMICVYLPGYLSSFLTAMSPGAKQNHNGKSLEYL